MIMIIILIILIIIIVIIIAGRELPARDARSSPAERGAPRRELSVSASAPRGGLAPGSASTVSGSLHLFEALDLQKFPKQNPKMSRIFKSPENLQKTQESLHLPQQVNKNWQGIKHKTRTFAFPEISINFRKSNVYLCFHSSKNTRWGRFQTRFLTISKNKNRKAYNL